MIVCKQCGHHNELGDTFCGSCGAFLEWMGEHIVEQVEPEPEPVPEAAVEPERAGLLTRIKEAVRGDEGPAAPLAAPASFAPPGPVGSPAAPLPPSGPIAAAPLAPPPAALLAPPSGGFAPPSAPSSAPSIDPAALAAAAAARAAAEEAARRTEREDAQRRAAAAMVAKPKQVTPTGPAPVRPAAAPAPSRAASPVGSSAAPAPVASDPAAGARQPAAQQPGAAAARPKPVTAKQAPSRIINPGDLVCGQCGEGNEPTRKFCRRCGGTLAEAAAAPKVGWFKRTFSRSGKQPAALAAGSRPGRDGSGGGGQGAAKGARIAKGKALGGFASFRRVLALLAMVGIGTTLAVPSLRTTVTDKGSSILSSIKSKVNPSYTGVSPNPEGITATGETPGHEAKLAADGIKNDYWLAPADSPIAKVRMPFTTPERVDLILVYSGAQEKPEDFKALPRPKDLFVRLVDSKGKETTKQFLIEDKADFQKLKISSKDVVLAEVTIQSCYPDPAVKVCAISELEFQKQK